MKKNLIIGIVILTAALSVTALSAVAISHHINHENQTAESLSAESSAGHEETVNAAAENTVQSNTASHISEASKQESSEKEKMLIDENHCTVEGLDNILFDGNEHTLGISVIYQGEVLENGTDYDVSYSGTLMNPDRYTAEIIFKGDYEGTIKKDFYILPSGTEITDIKTKTGSIHIDFEPQENLSGYQIEYSKKDDFSESEIFDTESAEMSSAAIDVEKDNATYYLRIRTYLQKDINGETEKLYSEWSEPKSAELLQIAERDGLTYVDGIIIANKTYDLPSDYAPDVNEEAVIAFEKMAADAAEDGIDLTIVSGYRSYDLQSWLYHSYVEERGQENADKISARPGHSEHQTGLAFDINTTASSFAGTPEAIWLDENCYKYGFIVRYPEGKEDITGYSYEPWHIRYIGYPYSEKVYESGLTLEEYLGITSKYSE